MLRLLFRPVFGKERVKLKVRLVLWTVFLGAIVGAYFWQPLRYDLIVAQPPSQAVVSPVEAGLFIPGLRVLVVTGHPDDSEFYCGGTLVRMHRAGVVLRLVTMTDGDKDYYPFGVPEGLTEVRQDEQTEAAARWGADTVFLAFRDGRLPVNSETVASLRKEIERFDPDLVLAPETVYRGRMAHKDHTNAGLNAIRAIKAWGTECKVGFYSTRAPNCYVDVSSVWFEKMELVALHKSQFYGERLAFIRGLLSGWALRDGTHVEGGLAEGLRLVTSDKL